MGFSTRSKHSQSFASTTGHRSFRRGNSHRRTNTDILTYDQELALNPMSSFRGATGHDPLTVSPYALHAWLHRQLPVRHLLTVPCLGVVLACPRYMMPMSKHTKVMGISREITDGRSPGRRGMKKAASLQRVPSKIQVNNVRGKNGKTERRVYYYYGAPPPTRKPAKKDDLMKRVAVAEGYNNGATAMQRVYRGKRGRDRAKAIRTRREQDAAATKIQALVRGVDARAAVQEIRRGGADPRTIRKEKAAATKIQVCLGTPCLRVSPCLL